MTKSYRRWWGNYVQAQLKSFSSETYKQDYLQWQNLTVDHVVVLCKHDWRVFFFFFFFFFLVFSVRRSKWEKSDVRWDCKWVTLHVPCSRDTITGWRPTVLLGRCEIGEAWRWLWELLRWLGQLFIEGGRRLTFPAGDLEWLASEICIGGRKLVTFGIRDARSWMVGVRFV